MKKLINTLLMNVTIYLLLFFMMPEIFMRSFEDSVCFILFILFIAITTGAFYITKLISKRYLLFSIPFLSVLIIQLNNRDIYGISYGGFMDITPRWVDSIIITVIIFFIQFFTSILCDIYFMIKDLIIAKLNK